MKADKLDEIRKILEDLESLDTFSRFSRLFYRLLYNWVRMCGDGASDLQRALCLLLRVEERRHIVVAEIIETGRLDVPGLLRAFRRARRTARRLQKVTARLRVSGSTQAMLKHLLLAECYYHLGHTGMVIASLRRALLLGCRHPIIFFALGYNLYTKAINDYAKHGKELLSAEAEQKFVKTCHSAIKAFKAGLEEQPFDAQLYWWIGMVHELLDAKEEARLAYQKAAEVDPVNFGRQAGKRMRKLLFAVPDAMTEEESRRLSKLPQISEEEMRRASQAIAGLDTFPTVSFGEDEK